MKKRAICILQVARFFDVIMKKKGESVFLSYIIYLYQKHELKWNKMVLKRSVFFKSLK